ncbi:hypothetical protein [Actimicrobium antarcticum]|uniref:NYN domain-containing protein n=1 Tax=Actimicrobium antarcticum TaxID=1051899 RepID=A0ABP7SHU6_9BURK
MGDRIMVSNDSDAEPALAAIRQDFPHTMIGFVMPIHPPAPGTGSHRRARGSLTKLADWTLAHLTDKQLHAAQLPAKVPISKKSNLKPPHW